MGWALKANHESARFGTLSASAIPHRPLSRKLIQMVFGCRTKGALPLIW